VSEAEDLLRELVEDGHLTYVRGFVVSEEWINKLTRALYSGKDNGKDDDERG
jgi:hypothetical protein